LRYDSSMTSPELVGSERVVELLNSAATSADAAFKLEQLQIVQEVLIHQEPALLDNFLDEVTGFQNDRAQDVRKFVVGFIEEACKKDPDLLPKVVANLQIMLSDSAVGVQKRVIQAMTHLYKATLAWLSKAKVISEDMEACWTMISGIKEIIVHLLDADNDGIRTFTVKFMEMLVLAQSHGEKSEGKRNDADFNLDDVPLALKLLRRRKLEEEGALAFEELIKYHESTHVSSANLMTCMGSLTNIAKRRPKQFMSKVVTALEMLQANLPPTLGKSQVSSVRKHLKNQLLALLKHPAAAEQYFTNITTLLTDLGASREEVNKAVPRFEELKRKAKRAQQHREAGGGSAPKRARVAAEDDEDEYEEEDDPKPSAASPTSASAMELAVGITETFVLERLSPSLATELVLRSMSKLPREMPPQFSNTYTPIAAAGTEGQVKHVARLLATQLTAARLGPGIEVVQQKRQTEAAGRNADEDDEDGDSAAVGVGKIAVIGQQSEAFPVPSEVKRKVTLAPAGMSAKRSRGRAVKLSEMTKPMEVGEREEMVAAALNRILNAQRAAKSGGAPHVRDKAITALAARMPASKKRVVLAHLLDDLPNRADLLFSWLYEEYCFHQGFNRAASLMSKQNDDGVYNGVLSDLVQGVIDKTEGADREYLLRRLFLEAPIVTDDAIQLLKQFVLVRGAAIVVVKLMKDLVRRRPTKKLNFLNFLLEFCSHEAAEVRETASSTVLELHANGDFTDIIEDYSVMYLRFLLSPAPPQMLFGQDRGRPESPPSSWTDGTAKACLYIYLALLPQNLMLFRHLAEVYVATSADIKRSILRSLDAAVRSMSLRNKHLMIVVETCPEGAETLVTRILHILTEKVRAEDNFSSKVN